MSGILGSSLSSSLKGNRGSFTLEATIAIPFFLLLLMFLINLMAVAAVYVAMDHAVSETAKIIAGTAFPLRDSGIVLDSVSKEIISKLIKEYYPLEKLGNEDFRLVEVRLLSEKKKQEPGLSHIDLKPEDITIVVVYKVKMPFPFVNSKEFTLSNIAVERAWTDG